MIRLAGLVGAILVSACQATATATPPMPTPSLAIVSADSARSVALANAAGDPSTKVVAVRLSTFGAEAHGSQVAAASTVVWAISLTGQFYPPSCGPAGPSPHPCPSPQTTELVLIDATTGAFIEGQVPDPAPPPTAAPAT